MKRYVYILLVVLLCMPYMDVCARNKRGKKQATISYVGGYVGAGYSQLIHKIPNSQVLGGGSGLLGIEYFMKHGKYFNFHLGFEAMYFNSMSRMNNFSLDAKFYYNDPQYENWEIDYYMNFIDYKEHYNSFSFGVPIMLGVEMKNFYIALGSKLRCGLSENYRTSTNLTIIARDPEFIEDLENLPNHNIGSKNLLSKGKLGLGLDVTASAEIGVILDSWLPSSMTIFGQVRNRKQVSYRLGVFADYGILDKNRYSHTNMLVAYPNMEVQDGHYVIPSGSMLSVYNNSILASDISNNIKFNSFVVGVKFAILVQMSDTPMPIKKKPMKRPIVRDIVLVGDTSYGDFICKVEDVNTRNSLNAQIVIFDINNIQDTLFNGEVAEDDFYSVKLNNTKEYGILVSRAGYIDYRDTIMSLVDTLNIKMQPIERNTVIILKNLLFDTNKTTIKNTFTESLEELYQLLISNPKMRIIITGHTDNMASEAYNQKLSEGRAKAVYKEMVHRGIDPKRMKWQGKGELEPIDTNETEEGRAVNRRVEIKVL